MRKSDALDHFHGTSALARALGITSQSVSQWPDEVPAGRDAEIFILTDGKVKAPRVEDLKRKCMERLQAQGDNSHRNQ